MSPKRDTAVWTAAPHTIAKIVILKNYLHAWFRILGRTHRGQHLLYVDGFAGPGLYANYPEGSPIAALTAAREALTATGPAWIAGDIHCALIEADPSVADHLAQQLDQMPPHARLKVHLLRATFADGMGQLRSQMPASFQRGQPLFVFIDPFGPTGVPFVVVRDILRSPRSEVLINLDADAIVRILKAGAAANHEAVLTEVFGDESWREPLSSDLSFRDQSLAVVGLYKNHLRAVPNVRYVYSFEMLTARKRVGHVGYFLVFASRHPLGLEKMKESMRKMDQSGTYQFSNALIGQTTMFRYDRPEDYSPLLRQHFVGRGPMSYAEVRDFALLETPFENPKSMLRALDKPGMLEVKSTDPKRRRGTFNEAKIVSIEFLEGGTDG